MIRVKADHLVDGPTFEASRELLYTARQQFGNDYEVRLDDQGDTSVCHFPGKRLEFTHDDATVVDIPGMPGLFIYKHFPSKTVTWLAETPEAELWLSLNATALGLTVETVV